METFNQIILYFINPTPGKTFGYYILLIVIILFLIGLSIYIKLESKKDKAFKKTLKKYITPLNTLSFLTLLYLIFRYYYVPLFSMRLFLYILLASIIYEIYAITKTYYKTYPKEQKRREERNNQNKYIPKKKKRKKKK